MQPLAYGSGDTVVIGYALGGFFLLNVLPGSHVAQPDPFIFANIKSNLKTPPLSLIWQTQERTHHSLAGQGGS